MHHDRHGSCPRRRCIVAPIEGMRLIGDPAAMRSALQPEEIYGKIKLFYNVETPAGGVLAGVWTTEGRRLRQGKSASRGA